MTRFLDYICESHFSNADYSKHDGKYISAVLDTITTKGYIGLGNEKVEKKVTVDDTVLKELKTAFDSNKLDLSKFNEIATSNSIPFKWTQIFKGTYTTSGGGQDAKYAESATAYCYNALTSKKTDDIVKEDETTLIDAIETTLAKKNIADRFIQSALLSAKKIIKSIKDPTKFQAAHVDGNDISKVNDSIKDIATVFSGKAGISKVLGQYIADELISQLYASKNKDDWNKADIVISDTMLDIKDAAKKWKKEHHFSTSNDINEFLNYYILKTKQIVPISLKAIDHAERKDIDDVRFISDGSISDATLIDSIEDVDISFSGEVRDPVNKVYAASVYLTATCKDHAPLLVTFRNKDPKHPSLVIEIKDMSSNSRGGNAVNKLYANLNKTSGFFKSINIKDANEFTKRIYTATGIKTQLPDTLIAQIKSVDKDIAKVWFDRTAYKAFIGFLEAYKDKYAKGKKVDLVDYFKFIYNLASGHDSKSIWWLVK